MQELVETPQEIKQDHLFISYASEDGPLAEWLSLKLTVEGYRVWCDRLKLLGGESYPTDIDKALKTSTFRVLALLSRHSIHKPNPLKERTIALNISKERGIDFLIPLNVDGLRPTELDWMTSDLTFILFHKSWAEGLNRLLKKLNQIKAPKDPVSGRTSAANWATTEDSIAHREETLWSNVLPIIELPKSVRRYFVRDNDALRRIQQHWPVFHERHHIWAFDIPTKERPYFPERQIFPSLGTSSFNGVQTSHVITHLLRRSLILYCMQRGLRRTQDARDIYFPNGLLTSDRLPYNRYDGKRVYAKAIGHRTFRLADGATRKSTYHLAPSFRPLTKRFGFPCYEINLRLVWTDDDGTEDPKGGSNRRRRALTKTWWNYQWLSRILAFTAWLTSGGKEQVIFSSDQGAIKIAGSPISTHSPVGINEETLSRISIEEDESEILNESDDEYDTSIESQALENEPSNETEIQE